jgi:hypothetical protein
VIANSSDQFVREILDSYQSNKVFVVHVKDVHKYPLTNKKWLNGRIVVLHHLDEMEDLGSVHRNFLDKQIPCYVLDLSVVSFWEYFSCRTAEHEQCDLEPQTFQNDFLCYQRKHRPGRQERYDALKNGNGVVTIGADKDMDLGLGDLEIWNNSFLNLVTERHQYPEAPFASEKTYKPILGMRPFLVLGAVDTFYQCLNQKGYYTFEKDFPPAKHTKQVPELLNFLQNMDKQVYYQSIKHKLLHNRSRLLDAEQRVKNSYRTFIEEVANELR